MNFFGRILKNKNLIILSSFLIILIFCVPFVAFAEGWDILGTLVSTISGESKSFATGLLGAIIALLNSITLVVLNLSLGFLNWTASGDFISGTIMSNKMVTTGWTATRNIANVLLIFGLIAVAISIMLEYEETKAKKMLVNFVWIALLINFTPVICTTIIDAANILMGIFLKGGVSQEFVRSIKDAQSAKSLEDIPNSFFLLLFSIVAAGIYILYGLLFIFRYITLWILVIISPIAFATKVFLPTKAANFLKYILPAQCEWDTWWKEFLNWTFIGVPAAFSIYLSNILMQSIAADQTSVTSAPSGDLSTSVFSYIFSLLIPLGVLVEGFIMTMSKGASFGSFNVGGSIKGLYNKASKKVVGSTYGRAKNTVVGGVAGGYTGLREGWANSRADIRQRKREGEEINWRQSIKEKTSGALRTGGRQSLEGVEKGTGFNVFQSRKNKISEDTQILEKAKEKARSEVKSYTKDEKKEVLIRNKRKTIEDKARINAVIGEETTKGNISDATIAYVKANSDIIDESTQEKLIKKRPDLVSLFASEKDRQAIINNDSSLLALSEEERNRRIDSKLVSDHMKGLKSGDRKNIDYSSMMHNVDVLRNLNETEFTAIAGKTPVKTKEEAIRENKQMRTNRRIVNSYSRITNPTAAQKEAYEKAKEDFEKYRQKNDFLIRMPERIEMLQKIIDDETSLGRPPSDSPPNLAYKAQEEKTKLASMVAVRTRELRKSLNLN